MEWNSGALSAEIVCEDEQTVRIHRAAACLTAPLSADTVTNREKGRLKFLYLTPALPCLTAPLVDAYSDWW